MAVFSLGLSAKLVMRFGIRGPLAWGLALAALGLALFARAPIDGSFTLDVLPAMVLLGLGAGVAFNPMLLAAARRRRAVALRPGLWPGQHRLHDGRRAGTGGAGQPAAPRAAGLAAAGAARRPR